jgi:hypothetical protein
VNKAAFGGSTAIVQKEKMFCRFNAFAGGMME